MVISFSCSLTHNQTEPFTQGREWQFGDRAEKNPDYKVKVTRLEGSSDKTIPSNKKVEEVLEDYTGESPKVQLRNDSTGWVFTLSNNDKKEVAHGIGQLEGETGDSRRDNLTILEHLQEIVQRAFPAESYRDIKANQGVKGTDDNLKGIHRFYAPVVVGNQEYLVKVTVKDRTGDGSKGIGGKDRLGAYQIVGIETEKAQSMTKPSHSEATSEVSPDADHSQSHSQIVEVATVPRYASDEITVREMLSGVKRDGDVIYVKKTGADGKEYWAKDETRRTRFFTEEPNQWAYEEKGGYWKDPNDQSGDLLQMNGGVFSKEESDVQADINSRAVMSLARANGIAPDQIDSFAAKITWSKDSKSLSVPGEYAMPFTQGREWQFGDRAEKNPDYKVKVTRLEKTTEDGLVDNETLKKKILSYQGKEAGDTQLKNDVTGWVLSISKRDADEIVHGISARREDAPRRVQESIVDNLVEIVRNAFPAESYHDIKASQGAKGKDVNLKGVHRFYSPVSVGGEGYLVKITVKDRTGYRGKNNGLNNQDRLGVYQVVGMEITKARSDSKPLKNSDNEGQVAAEGSRNQSLERPSQQTAFSEDEITIREMLSGVKRDGDVIYVKKTGADGKEYWAKDETRRTRFFTEEPNQWAYEEKGGYWMDPNDQSGDLLQISDELFQLAYHGSPYVFDTFTLSHIGSGEGAQAHGWGLYFALTREVSEGYLRRLTRSQRPKYHISDGRVLEELNLADPDVDARAMSGIIRNLIYSDLVTDETQNISAELVQKEAKESLAKNESYLAKWQRKKPRTKEARQEKEFWIGMLSGKVNALKKLIESPVSIEIEKPGRLYTVDIPEDDVMLREGALLKNQPKKVRDALRKIFASADKDGFAGAFMEQWEADDSLGMKAPVEAVNKIRKKYGNSPEAIERIRRLVGRLVREHYKGLSESEKRDYALKDAVHDMTESVETFLRNWTPREIDPEGPKLEDITGKEIYEMLVDRMGSPKAASEILRDHGVLGVRYYGAIDGECAVVWDEASIKILHELEQAMGRDGSIRGAFQTGNNTIRLTPNANLSTFSPVQRPSVFLGLFQITQNEPRSLIF